MSVDNKNVDSDINVNGYGIDADANDGSSNTLLKLSKLIEGRKSSAVDKSYVASLIDGGLPKITQKIGEESAEVIIAALVQKDADIVNESADLLFHLSILWSVKNISPQQIMEELENRMGISGLDEKALRNAKNKGKA